MPEYLAPGVYVEETSFRSKSIEGVSTSTAGFVGPTRFGPISGQPELVTNFLDFQRMYGGLEDLVQAGIPRINYLAHGVRAFFEEGGRRLYIARVFSGSLARGANGVPQNHSSRIAKPAGAIDFVPPTLPSGQDNSPYSETIQANGGTAPRTFAFIGDLPAGLTLGADGTLSGTPTTPGAYNFIVTVKDNSTPPVTGSRPYSLAINDTNGEAPDNPAEPTALFLVARFPGRAGNVRVTLTLKTGKNALISGRLTRVRDGDVVYRSKASNNNGLFVVRRDSTGQTWELHGSSGAPVPVSSLSATEEIIPMTVVVQVEQPTDSDARFLSRELLGEFDLNPISEGYLLSTFIVNPARRRDALTIPFAFDGLASLGTNPDEIHTNLLSQLFEDVIDFKADEDAADNDQRTRILILDGGSDGDVPAIGEYAGNPAGVGDYQNDPLQSPKNGLLAFESVPDISIVAAPGYSAAGGDIPLAIQGALISHCTRMHYRIAVLDTPKNMLVGDALSYRNNSSSTYAAIYYPWVYVADPRPGQGGKRLLLPPSGFISGIYARNDINRAVYKAPANEVVRLAIDFEQRLSKAHQDVLNPEGVNCFRFFEGRGFLLWGARTISDDPEWKYVNLRRYFAYLERSIERGTQWAVFEPNNEPLWANVRRTIEDFLLNEWKMGALMGNKPEQAYFVKCDRSTMTQNDIDNGRLICLIGVSPVRPAEFVIFRIGQWTADAK